MEEESFQVTLKELNRIERVIAEGMRGMVEALLARAKNWHMHSFRPAAQLARGMGFNFYPLPYQVNVEFKCPVRRTRVLS
mmetsp:Transcript_9859/g.28959  ORF Transcript_9859/g.28959 Transcript_9859/m.28959 type:complete len:80 (-) Transcript_9859:43-282(-)